MAVEREQRRRFISTLDTSESTTLFPKEDDIFISRCQFVKCNEFNPIHIIGLKAGISSSLHTIILRNKTQTKHLIDLIFFCVYFSL